MKLISIFLLFLILFTFAFTIFANETSEEKFDLRVLAPGQKLFMTMRINKFYPKLRGQDVIGKNELLKLSNILYTRFNRTQKIGIALTIVGCFVGVLLFPGIPMLVVGTIRKTKFMNAYRSLTKEKFQLFHLNEIKY